MRISDWSSDVCSSDLCFIADLGGYAAWSPALTRCIEHSRTDGGNLQPLPLREVYKLGQSARSTGGMEQSHGFFRHHRLQPFGIPRLRRLINIALDDLERRRIKGASIPAAGMENATITLGSTDFYKSVYVHYIRCTTGTQRPPG